MAPRGHRLAVALAAVACTLLAAPAGALTQFGFPRPFALVADIDVDGYPDVVFSTPGSAKLTVLRGKGDGTFLAGLDHATGPAPTEFAVGDLDGDGIPDIVVAQTGVATAGVLKGLGDGTFADLAGVPLPGLARSVALGDLNGDGKLDLVAGTSAPNTVTRMLGKGDGTFGPAVHVFTPSQRPANIALADFSRDGQPDLVALVLSDSVVTAVGDGAGGFETPQVQDLPFQLILPYSGPYFTYPAEPLRLTRLAGGTWFFAVHSPEATGDHGVPVDKPTFYHGVIGSDGTVSAFRWWVPFLDEPLVPIHRHADLTGDGQADFVMGRDPGAIIHVAAPPPAGPYFTPYSFTTPSAAVDVATGDMNLDGIEDVVVVGADGHGYVKLNAGPYGGTTYGMGSLPYVVKATVGSHGSIFPAGSLPTGAGGTRSFRITPDLGYMVDDVLVDGASIGAVTTATVGPVTSNRTIKALFLAAPAGVDEADPAIAFAPVMPTPSSGRAVISISLAEATTVRLEIIDGAGRRLRTIARGTLAAGRHEWTWRGARDDGKQASSGVYFARLAVPGRRDLVRRLVWID